MGWEEGQLAGMAVLELSVCGMDELHAPSTMPLPRVCQHMRSA